MAKQQPAQTTVVDAPEPTQKELDEKFLTDAGWSQSGSLWVNPTWFVFFNDHGRTQSVPEGVKRPLAEAVKLERSRPLTNSPQ